MADRSSPTKPSEASTTGAVRYLNHSNTQNTTATTTTASTRPVLNVPQDLQYSLLRFTSQTRDPADEGLRDPVEFRTPLSAEQSRERMTALMHAAAQKLPSQRK